MLVKTILCHMSGFVFLVIFWLKENINIVVSKLDKTKLSLLGYV